MTIIEEIQIKGRNKKITQQSSKHEVERFEVEKDINKFNKQLINFHFFYIFEFASNYFVSFCLKFDLKITKMRQFIVNFLLFIINFFLHNIDFFQFIKKLNYFSTNAITFFIKFVSISSRNNQIAE